jgi:hypothetical protein
MQIFNAKLNQNFSLYQDEVFTKYHSIGEITTSTKHSLNQLLERAADNKVNLLGAVRH